MTTPSPTRRVIQIATWGSNATDHDGCISEVDALYALCDDGTIWSWLDKARGWSEVTPVPQPAADGTAVPRG
jgi:hypothetical protein